MIQPTQDPNEGEAQKILQEDTDDIVNENELTRIIRLYIGREANEEEMTRFTGMKESELKILTDYLNTIREDEKTNQEANKVKNGLALKGMKAMGEQNIAMMKGKPTDPMMPPPSPMGQPDMGNSPIGNGGTMSPDVSSGRKYVPEGRFSLLKFQ